MHLERLLHKLLSPVMHLKRKETLVTFVITALNEKKLSLTNLGRGIKTAVLERSNIRRSDRLLGNTKLHEEREGIYQVIITNAVGSKQRPEIIIDWSHIPNTTSYVLRASLAGVGRGITLYEEVYPKEKENNPKVQKQFLRKLKKLLPQGIRPIIITDAGFQNPWFREVERLGWDYIGRVRGRKSYRHHGEKRWKKCKDLFSCKITKGYVGEVEMGQEKPLLTHFYVVKQTNKGRKRLNKYGKKSKQKKDKEYASSAGESWLLATSLGKGHSIESRVYQSYGKRMQIEESFRDLKSSQYGLSLEDARSKIINRIEILLLIAMLASWIAWVVGWVSEKKSWQYQFQANSIKHKRVLSLFFLGCQVIRKKLTIPIEELLDAIEEIKALSTCYI